MDEIESVLEGNAFMAELQARIVPLVVTREEFWQRYFYALRRIKLEFGVEKEEDEKDEKQEEKKEEEKEEKEKNCLLYTSPSPRDVEESRMPSSA